MCVCRGGGGGEWEGGNISFCYAEIPAMLSVLLAPMVVHHFNEHYVELYLQLFLSPPWPSG